MVIWMLLAIAALLLAVVVWRGRKWPRTGRDKYSFLGTVKDRR